MMINFFEQTLLR